MLKQRIITALILLP
ncbi:MAG: hypothetical protein RSB64_11230, partial [Pseudomonas sp.]